MSDVAKIITTRDRRRVYQCQVASIPLEKLSPDGEVDIAALARALRIRLGLPDLALIGYDHEILGDAIRLSVAHSSFGEIVPGVSAGVFNWPEAKGP